MEGQPDTPVTHPLTDPVTTLTTEQLGRNDGHRRPCWEATLRGRSPDILFPAPDTNRRTP